MEGPNRPRWTDLAKKKPDENRVNSRYENVIKKRVKITIPC